MDALTANEGNVALEAVMEFDCQKTRPTKNRLVTSLRVGAGVAYRVAVVAVTIAVAGVAAAQTPDAPAVINREYPIKAAFLYHFSSYVEWPESAFPRKDEPFVIGVYQVDPFGTALERIAGTKKAAGRTIVVHVINDATEVPRCQILFVPMSVPSAEQAAAIQAAQRALVLVVGESDDFVARGGDVQFFVQGNKVRFAFNAEITHGGDLKVSSKLLSLAKIIPNR